MREAEEIESARIVGVDVVEFLGQPDGILEYGVPLRREICAVVRKHRPEIVITGYFHETFGGRNLNQADHIATGRAVLDAVRDAGNRWVFPEQLVDGVEPWGGVRQVWVGGSPRPSTASTPPTPSTRAWTRWPPTRRTSRVSAGRTGTRASSSRASAGRPDSGWAWRSRAAFEVYPMGGED